MNVNGSRFDLLLGRDDWGRCLDGDGAGARTLASWWDGALASPPVELGPELPAWDARRRELSIRPLSIELPATPGETPVDVEARRGAAADRHRNVYSIGLDRRSLIVHSAGSRRATTFWPAEPAPCEQVRVQERLDFAPLVAGDAGAPESYLALAVTADDYLVVAFARGAGRGLLSFDLVAGGSPAETVWPAVELEPFDMAARHGGGVWLLDRENRRLWELDCKLAVVSVAQNATTLQQDALDDFQPLAGKQRERAAVAFPGGIELAPSSPFSADLTSVVDPIAVEALDDGAVLLLDVDVTAGRSRVMRLRRDGGAWRSDPSRWLDELPGLAHDFVYATGRLYQFEESVEQLFLVTSNGNQARAYTVQDSPTDFILGSATELFPLRRFGGRALLAIKEDAYYDSGIGSFVWAPLVEQPRTLFELGALVVTPVFDSGEIGTTWDRVHVDACLPPDTTIEIRSRAGDERADLLDGAASPGVEAPQVVGTWLPEPLPHLRATGGELPWLRAEAARATRREAGIGTWELLLQNARGRYLQLEVRLKSANSASTPRLRALRVWSPRFSYPQRFLPAVYREDATAGPFLERWLANVESTLTNLEDRIVNLQALFDPRTAPADALAWLASWFDVAFDPAWDERRQRLFVRHAMDFFRWRGTVHGLRLALDLAFDPCIEASLFTDPSAGAAGPRGIRIVEAYQTRLAGGPVSGDPAAPPGPREIRREARWLPSEGSAGLIDRFARLRGGEATSEELVVTLPLVPPTEAEGAATWRALWESALGFAPSTGTRDRARWQDFLARRYRRIERLNRAHESSWASFDVADLPTALPHTEAAQVDWLQFHSRLLPMQRTAHRFSVLLPVADVTTDPYQLEARLGLARRVVELEKPAHTVFDVRFYWAFFRVGEARLGVDTLLGAGSRAPELVPEAVLGRAYVGSSFVGGDPDPGDGDRLRIAC